MLGERKGIFRVLELAGKKIGNERVDCNRDIGDGITDDVSTMAKDWVSKEILKVVLMAIFDRIPKETPICKLKSLKSAAEHAKFRQHAAKAVLARLKHNKLPSEDEAKRFSSVLIYCEVQTFKEEGHTFFLEDGNNLLTVIKATKKVWSFKKARLCY